MNASFDPEPARAKQLISRTRFEHTSVLVSVFKYSMLLMSASALLAHLDGTKSWPAVMKV